jgi:hypothetical protein
MQVIDPTFRAYKDSRHDVGPYMYGTSTEGMSNILASMHYALARYGSLSAAYNKAGGYAGGGVTPAGDPFWVGEQGPELMWSSRQKYVSTAAQSREFSGGSGGSVGSSGGSANVVVNARVITMVTTPQPSNVPPRVKIDITDTGTPAINVRDRDAAGHRRRHVETVRTSDGLALTAGGHHYRTATVYDYEMPLGSSVTYSTVEKPAVTSTTLIDSSVVWLVHPGVPALSMPVDFRIHSFESEELAVKAGVFYPMGRRNAVSVTDGRRRGATGSFTVGLDTLSDLTSLRALLDDASVLLLNVPASFNLGLDSRYLAIQDVTIKRRSDVGSDPGRDVVMPYVTVDSPVGGSQSQWAWSNVISQYATWTALIAAEPTWTDVFSPTN